MKLPVSRKFYSDISSRVSAALTDNSVSKREAMRLIDSYISGCTDCCSQDAMALLAFNMVRAELDRAMVRSANARRRAMERKARQESPKAESMSQDEMCDVLVHKYIAEHPRVPLGPEATSPSPSGYTRRERRHLKNTAKRITKSKWKKL